MVQAGSADHISDHEFALLKKLIAQKIGVDLPVHKKHLLISRLRSRLLARDCSTFLQYYKLISEPTGSAELHTALDLMTTNETYFFREPEHFTFLKQWLANRQHHSVHIWAAACSSGEEPYSIAMTLHQHCRQPWDILATDINSNVLQAGKEAIYSDRRTDGIPPEYRRRYCREGVEQYAGYFRICPELRSKVTFYQQNLTQAITVTKQLFDIIFLRNVMIYFDTPTRQKVVDRLSHYLKPEGHLIVSHAESLHGVSQNFCLIQPGVYQLCKPYARAMMPPASQ